MIGGGFSGMASAARLAKLGHQVTLFERAERLGGALGQLEVQGWSFDTGPTHTLLPAVIRDLFRKSGRPLEREADLVPLEVVREHRFADGSALQLTGGSRAAQKVAFDRLSPGLGTAWVQHVDPYSGVWESLRRNFFERPWNADLADPEAVRLLTERARLSDRLAANLPDPRARLVAGHPHVRDGHDLRKVPAWAGVVSYLEQNFGAWTVPGGIGVLGEVMARRVRTRKVEVHTSTPVTDVLLRRGRVVAVRTPDGEVEADAVVCAVDPSGLPSLRSVRSPAGGSPRHLLTRRPTPAPVPDLLHLGLVGDGVLDEQFGPDLPGELVLHGEDRSPDLVLRPGGSAPSDLPGARAVTVHSRGVPADQVLDLLASRGLDLRPQVEVQVARSGAELTRIWGGSPLGAQWDGRRTVATRPGPRTTVAGLYAAGAHANPGAGLPFTGLSAWLVAQSIGPA